MVTISVNKGNRCEDRTKQVVVALALALFA
jgi:hypothetical protein